jgi:hypothetical protein
MKGSSVMTILDLPARVDLDFKRTAWAFFDDGNLF